MKNDDKKLISQLINQGRNHAEKHLREDGHLPPIFLGLNTREMIGLMPQKLEDAQDKERFVTFARIACIAHELKAVAFVAEAWSAEASRDEPADTPPSESLYRKECLLIMCEIRDGTNQPVFFPIIRTDAGTYFGLGEPEFADEDSARGRFPQFLPRRQPTPAERKQARLMLKAMTRAPAKERRIRRY